MDAATTTTSIAATTTIVTTTTTAIHIPTCDMCHGSAWLSSAVVLVLTDVYSSSSSS